MLEHQRDRLEAEVASLRQQCEELEKKKQQHSSKSSQLGAPFLHSSAPSPSPSAPPPRDNRFLAESEVDRQQKYEEIMTCSMCLSHEVEIALVPCGHVTTCTECAAALSVCPICRAQIRSKLRIYHS